MHPLVLAGVSGVKFDFVGVYLFFSPALFAVPPWSVSSVLDWIRFRFEMKPKMSLSLHSLDLVTVPPHFFRKITCRFGDYFSSSLLDLPSHRPPLSLFSVSGRVGKPKSRSTYCGLCCVCVSLPLCTSAKTRTSVGLSCASAAFTMALNTWPCMFYWLLCWLMLDSPTMSRDGLMY